MNRLADDSSSLLVSTDYAAKQGLRVGDKITLTINDLEAEHEVPFIVVPRGQSSIAWFSGVALLGIFILTGVGRWYRDHTAARAKAAFPGWGLRRMAVR